MLGADSRQLPPPSTQLTSAQHPVPPGARHGGCPPLTGLWNLGAVDAQPVISDLLPTGDKGTQLWHLPPDFGREGFGS